MDLKHKGALFILVAFALMVPYLGFALYFAPQDLSGQWPGWLVDTIAIWFVTNFVVLMLVAKRLFRGSVVDPEKARAAAEKSVTMSIPLVILWSLVFLYGVKETIQGKLQLQRAIPAGVFLLFFIGLFGWGIYRAKRKKAG